MASAEAQLQAQPTDGEIRRAIKGLLSLCRVACGVSRAMDVCYSTCEVPGILRVLRSKLKELIDG